jgi:hypothetical protein
MSPWATLPDRVWAAAHGWAAPRGATDLPGVKLLGLVLGLLLIYAAIRAMFGRKR